MQVRDIEFYDFQAW